MWGCVPKRHFHLSDTERKATSLPGKHLRSGIFANSRNVFFDLRTSEEKVLMALKMLLVKVGVSDIGFGLGVTEETLLMRLEHAAHKTHEMNMHWLSDLGEDGRQ
jgi:hypothetical protein